ncbi:MAG: c-type cytochrome biogenesis protein CcsB [Nitrospira sp.]|nr:c-type cytochrome biogenesis protein CcsB [Nitrospira sp.]
MNFLSEVARIGLMPVTFFIATIILYFAGTGFFLAYLLRRSEALSQVSLGVTAVGFLTHTLALLTRMLEAGQVTLASFHEAMSFFSWALVLVFLFVEIRHRIHVLGSFILPLALISLLSAAALPKEVPTLEPVLKTVWVHVTLSMLGTVGFAVAFVAGIMYLIQDGLLKSKRFNVLYSKLPPLDFLDRLNQQSIVMGFPLLTVGIIAGAFSAEFARGSYLSWNPEQLWALVTWLFYFVVLMGRLTVGWRAKRAAYLTIIGFAGVVLTFIGVVLKAHGGVA